MCRKDSSLQFYAFDASNYRSYSVGLMSSNNYLENFQPIKI